MQLSRLLKQIMAEKGISNKNIIDNCKKLGIEIDNSYISKILSDKIKNPSNDKLEAIAKGCEVDPNIFVLENYLNNAPQVLTDFLYNFRTACAIAGTKIYDDLLCNLLLKDIQRIICEMPMSKFILEDNDFDISYITKENNSIKIEDNGENFSVQLVDSIYIKVLDDSMEPIIPINSKITLYPPEDDYNNYKEGDILAVQVKNEKSPIVRQVYISKNSITLTVINNSNYSAKKYKKEDVAILGKIHKVIKEF